MQDMKQRDCVVASTIDVPLVVDVDGTLLKTDLLAESLMQFIAKRSLSALALPFTLLTGKAALKAHIADQVAIDVSTLPLNEQMLDEIHAARAQGRRVYLASASNRRYVEALAKELGCFDGVFASDATVNLSGSRKAERLCQEFGPKGFDYAANDAVDMHVWDVARNVIAVDGSPSLLRRIAQRYPAHKAIGRLDNNPRAYLRALRPHQWAKNALLIVPMLAAHKITAGNLGLLALAFIAFSLTASCVYVVNDLLDLQNDRAHPTKRRRPFAAGAIPLTHGMVGAPLLLLAGLATAATVSLSFVLALIVYFAITTAYSFSLKRKPVIDVMTLAGLYSMRVVAGAVAISVPLSPWMLAFSTFIFLCLALIKRYAEIVDHAAGGKGPPAGRGYHIEDAPLIMILAGVSGYAAILVLTLYIDSPNVKALYAYPLGLWTVCVLMLYWITRVLLITHRGEMHHDPVVFALRDRVSLITLALCGLAVFGSALL